MKKEYNYFIPSTHQQVSLPKSSLLKKIFCNHDMVPLIRNEKDSIILCISGDTIQYVCTKCGKLGSTEFWEFEGMGYK
jgi:hypothetical protein